MRVLLVVCVLSLVLSACGGGGGSKARAAAPGGSSSSDTGSSVTGLAALQRSYERVVARLSPAVVQIETDEGLGSGIVFDDRGDIVTNAHVVGSASTFTVTRASGARSAARLVGRWVPGDLAVIRAQGSGLEPAQFADSGDVKVGQITVAIGNPLGLRSSVTQGIVSSLGRTVSEGNGVTLPAAIQTSAAINPGNSGGALADIQGRVIGIPTLAATDPQLGGGAAPGIGFAIPSNTVKRIARQLVDDGRVTRSGRAALGVRVATVTGGGVIVVGVVDGGAADAAGVRPRDRLVSLDGKPIASVDALQNVLAGLSPGRRVPLTVQDPGGGRRTVRITLGQLQG